jgi:signal transduction histidine kinase
MSTIFYSYQQEQLEIHKQDLANSAEMLSRNIDDCFFKLTRAAAEYVNRRNTLEEVVNFAQEGVLSSFIDAYVSNLELDVQITNPQNITIYKSWDSLNYGNIASQIEQGEFQPKIINLEGKKHFAVGLKIQDSHLNLLGYIMVASAIDNDFLNNIKLNKNDIIKIGFGDEVISQSGNSDQRDFSARSYLKINPNVWVDIYHHPVEFNFFGDEAKHGIRNTIIILLIILFIFNGYSIWKSTEQLIIDPILKIQSVIIENTDSKILEDLPKNEIGELGRELLKQKNEIHFKNKDLISVSEEYKKEATLVKVLSHDLSTPLTVIKLSIIKLRKELIEVETQVYKLDRIMNQVHNIESILTHVKEMKALESGKKKLVVKEINFGDAIYELAADFAEKLNSKELTLDWMPSEGKTLFVAEAISFHSSVLSNLLSNAIKFSERGSRIELRCREINGFTRIDVRDFGPGIPINLREHLFSPTHETNREGSEGEKGTGFGMSIVQFYTNLYGGTIEFSTKTKEESLTDHGTTFSLILKSKREAA